MAREDNLTASGTFKKDKDLARRAQLKSTETRLRRRNMRETVKAMMTAKPKVDAATLKGLRELGLEETNPTLQTIICANLMSIATLKRYPKSALQAIEIIGELTGCDASTTIASERLRLDKARFKLEKERFELEKAKASAGDDEATVVIEV